MTVHLVVFGREPVPGRVKTRLAASVGAARAAAVYGALLEHTLGVALAARVPVTLSLAEAPSMGWRAPLDVSVEVQREGDLGARMAASFARHFGAGASVVVLVGSDCPALSVSHVKAAVEGCRQAPVVIGPASDGGYWLVAQRAPGIDLFSGVPWSSPTTLAATRAGLAAAGRSWLELETLSDIDSADDLERAISATQGQAVGRMLEAALADEVSLRRR